VLLCLPHIAPGLDDDLTKLAAMLTFLKLCATLLLPLRLPQNSLGGGFLRIKASLAHSLTSSSVIVAIIALRVAVS
jgi:hypothetical protein